MHTTSHFISIPARPVGPVNPAELPAAEAVLDAALLPLHPQENHPQVYQTLASRFQNLSEELHHLMFGDAAEESCVVIPLYR